MSKRVIITGAASGIGEATARALRGRGAEVIGLDLKAGDGILACDVTDQSSVDAAIANAVKQMGGLDALVNCAGIGLPQSASERPGPDALRALDGKPTRDLATTRQGAVSYRLVGLLPKGLVEGAVRRRMRSGAKRGLFKSTPMTSDLLARLDR